MIEFIGTQTGLVLYLFRCRPKCDTIRSDRVLGYFWDFQVHCLIIVFHRVPVTYLGDIQPLCRKWVVIHPHTRFSHHCTKTAWNFLNAFVTFLEI